MVKRYIALIAVTAVAIAAIITAGELLKTEEPVVTLYEVTTRKVEETVSCTGRIESADSRTVTTPIPCVVGDVYVKAGDSVKEGDKLFSVDIEATRSVLATAGGVSASLIGDDQIPGEVTAPVNGIVSTLNASTGGTLNLNQACAVISLSDQLQVKVAIHENKLKNIAVGQNAVISGNAFSKSGYTGTVTHISSSARQQYVGTSSETVVDAIVTLTQHDTSLKPGLTAKTVIKISEAVDRLVVPYDYVMQDELNQEYVYAFSNGYAVKRVVQTGKELSSGFEILDGLVEGEMIVAGPDKLSGPQVRVRVVEKEESDIA